MTALEKFLAEVEALYAQWQPDNDDDTSGEWMAALKLSEAAPKLIAIVRAQDEALKRYAEDKYSGVLLARDARAEANRIAEGKP